METYLTANTTRVPRNGIAVQFLQRSQTYDETVEWAVGGMPTTKTRLVLFRRACMNKICISERSLVFVYTSKKNYRYIATTSLEYR